MKDRTVYYRPREYAIRRWRLRFSLWPCLLGRSRLSEKVPGLKGPRDPFSIFKDIRLEGHCADSWSSSSSIYGYLGVPAGYLMLADQVEAIPAYGRLHDKVNS